MNPYSFHALTMNKDSLWACAGFALGMALATPFSGLPRSSIAPILIASGVVMLVVNLVLLATSSQFVDGKKRDS
jgi:hypothetical protein